MAFSEEASRLGIPAELYDRLFDGEPERVYIAGDTEDTPEMRALKDIGVEIRVRECYPEQ